MSKQQSVTRREFLTTVTAATVTIAAAPAIATASKTRKQTIVGSGEHQFEVVHDFAKLPGEYTWQTTHNVAVDKAGNLYVIHEGHVQKKDHPSIFVFDPKGKFIRAFGSEYQGGGHGIEVREEGGQEFLYVCGYQQVKMFSKMDLKGEVVWRKYAPMECGVYAKNEDTDRKKIWGRNRFMPTNFAFLDDGGFLLADGYGSFFIHRYDKDANWVSMFGGPGNGKGKFATAHGLWIDRREGKEPTIVVTDRAHHTLQTFTMDGKYIETLPGYGLPANLDSWKDLLVVPELHARVTLLGKDNQVVARLGDDVDRVKSTKGLRGMPGKWQDGKFVHPHDACFDHDGSIFVAEWVATGRVSKLQKV
ncbi:MAG: hypothetical protein CMJ78_18965 [Planctomycetaceae bacterium]|nr:hypothetical protein [Planctomycetaceae bacterium]